MSKYAIGGSQGRYQPGSNDTVLENSLGITDSSDMDEAELVLLEKLYRDVLFDHLPQGEITVDEIKTCIVVGWVMCMSGQAKNVQ